MRDRRPLLRIRSHRTLEAWASIVLILAYAKNWVPVCDARPLDSEFTDGSLHVETDVGIVEREYESVGLPEARRVSLLTPYGPIRISLFSENSPLTAKALYEESQKREKTCKGCRFYRAEKRAPEGPPYALLQGSFGEAMELPTTKEGSKTIRAGHVVVIPPTKDFYIALQDHPEWSNAHTVVGIVDDFVSTDLICVQWTSTYIHPEFSTEMKMLREPVDFVLTDDMSERIMPKFSHGHIRSMPLENIKDGNEEYEYVYEYVDGPKDKGMDANDVDTKDDGGDNRERPPSLFSPPPQRHRYGARGGDAEDLAKEKRSGAIRRHRIQSDLDFFMTQQEDRNELIDADRVDGQLMGMHDRSDMDEE